MACGDTAALTTAYRDVVERYRLSAIDLDVEGAVLADQAAATRRAEAMAAVQRARAEDGEQFYEVSFAGINYADTTTDAPLSRPGESGGSLNTAPCPGAQGPR